MNRLLGLLVLAACSSSVSSQHIAGESGKHVIVISIDGFRPEMYNDKTWPTPNLQWLMKQGTYADHMLSVFPAYTYPSHTAMLTGAMPARSGIFYNVRNDKGEWNWFTKDIKAPTLWQAVRSNGMTSSAVQWPVSVSDDITYNVPEIWNPKYPEDRISETRKYATKGLVEELEANATGKLDGENMSEEHFSLDENAGRMAAYIFKNYKPDLLCVHFALVDGMEHAYGRDHDSVRLAVATADRAIGNILLAIQESGIKDSTTVLIVGDHGFSDMHTVLRPNILLKDLNVRFTPAGGSAFLYAKTDMQKAERDKMVNEVTKRLSILKDEYRKLFRIINRKELDRMGADSSALLALAAIPGLVFGGSSEGELTGHITGGHHGYDPHIPQMYTGFIAAGAGINKGAMIQELCVTDIAPLIAKLLGIPFKCPDGKLPAGILQ